ncbi:Protein of unknown function [Pyronema omphalodes CBS 100304]|uniref:Uncharacterized protein n=1 Tax=Pyronema omphalodes (strain CBS 100304) TaxID=1076935 RepID=U4KY62_PYROM|nr:Protein of unknown function [Pyronema omphalodes CBS 100304]
MIICPRDRRHRKLHGCGQALSINHSRNLSASFLDIWEDWLPTMKHCSRDAVMEAGVGKVSIGSLGLVV